MDIWQIKIEMAKEHQQRLRAEARTWRTWREIQRAELAAKTAHPQVARPSLAFATWRNQPSRRVVLPWVVICIIAFSFGVYALITAA